MKKKAQIAIEYLILTSFILTGVIIIFGFSIINYNQNIKAAQTSDAISKLANAIDDVYTRGEGNTRFIKITWPKGMKGISVIHKCTDGRQKAIADDCGGSADPYDDVKFSGIAMEMQLLGQDTNILESTRAKIFETLEGMTETTAQGFNKYSGSAYIVKVSWTNDALIKLEKT